MKHSQEFSAKLEAEVEGWLAEEGLTTDDLAVILQAAKDVRASSVLAQFCDCLVLSPFAPSHPSVQRRRA